MAGRREERTRRRSPLLEVALERAATVRRKRHHALLVALAVAYAQPARLEVEVIERELNELRALTDGL